MPARRTSPCMSSTTTRAAKRSSATSSWRGCRRCSTCKFQPFYLLEQHGTTPFIDVDEYLHFPVNANISYMSSKENSDVPQTYRPGRVRGRTRDRDHRR